MKIRRRFDHARVRLGGIVMAGASAFASLAVSYSIGSAGGYSSNVSQAGQAQISAYTSAVRRLYRSPCPSDDKINNLRMSDLKHLAHLLYEANAVDPELTLDSLSDMAEGGKGTQSVPSTAKPGSLQADIMTRVKNEISPLAYFLIRVPYMLNVRIVQVRKTRGLDNIDQARAFRRGKPTTIIDAVVEEAFKGAPTYSQGDTVEFFFRDGWLMSARTSFFEIGNEYFVPIEPRDRKNLALVMYMDDSNGIYPIDGGFLLDRPGLFQVGDTVSVTQLRNKLNEKIREITSW